MALVWAGPVLGLYETFLERPDPPGHAHFCTLASSQFFDSRVEPRRQTTRHLFLVNQPSLGCTVPFSSRAVELARSGWMDSSLRADPFSLRMAG